MLYHVSFLYYVCVCPTSILLNSNLGDHSLHPSKPSLHSSKVSLTPSQASSQSGDVPQSPKSPKSPKDEEEKNPEKKKKKGFFKRVKDKVTGLLEGSDESDGGDGESSSASSSSESSSDDEKEKKWCEKMCTFVVIKGKLLYNVKFCFT